VRDEGRGGTRGRGRGVAEVRRYRERELIETAARWTVIVNS